jgi:hypothetical protein
MGNNDILSNMHIVAAFYPVADAFAGGITTDAVSLANYKRATLLISTGAIEDAGISNIVTVEACTAAAGTNNTAMAFRSRVCASSTTVDVWSALTARAATGNNFATANAVANAIWMLEVTAVEVASAVAGGMFVRAVIAETANKTITAGGIWILSEPRFPNSIPVQAIA